MGTGKPPLPAPAALDAADRSQADADRAVSNDPRTPVARRRARNRNGGPDVAAVAVSGVSAGTLVQMVGADLLKLRSTRSVAGWALALTAGIALVFYAYALIAHATPPDSRPGRRAAAQRHGWTTLQELVRTTAEGGHDRRSHSRLRRRPRPRDAAAASCVRRRQPHRA